MSRVFMTGGTGSIGKAVLQQLVLANHEVCALARSAGSAQQVVDLGAQPVMGDITAPEQWIEAAATSDVFIHLASSSDLEMAQSEPRLLAALFDAVRTRTVPLRFLYTGGGWLFGQTGNDVADEATPLRAITAFKWAQDAIESLPDRPGLLVSVIHPAMVYAPDGGVFARMMRALRAGRPAPLMGSEHIRWPLIHCDDAARAYLAIATAADPLGVFNLVAEQGIPVGEIARVLGTQAGVKTPPAVLPRKWALRQHGIWAEGPMLDLQMRSTRMAGLIWAPEITDFSAVTYEF